MSDIQTIPPQTFKKPWLSKTLWTNVIIAGAAFFPPVAAWISAHSEAFSMAWAAINMVLRVITKDSLTFWE